MEENVKYKMKQSSAVVRDVCNGSKYSRPGKKGGRIGVLC